MHNRVTKRESANIPIESVSTSPRRRLVGRLEQATGVVLLSGIPGSGRTTVVASWAHGLEVSGHAVFWITAPPKRGTPVELWDRLLGTSTGSLDQFVDLVSASGAPSVVVLDDADAYLTSDHIVELVELIARAPLTRLVLIGHLLPDFPVTVAVTRVRSLELRASVDELAAIAQSVGLPLPRMAMDAVDAGFRGWLTPSLIALRGLGEAMADGREPEHAYELAMEKATAFVRNEFDDTAAIEALKPLRLWQCADELTAETARVAIGVPRPHRIIAQMEDEGAVLPIPGASPPAWTRNLSPVLAVVLEEESARRFPDETRAAHSRLSLWHLENGDESGAVSHAVSAEDWTSVTDLLTVHWSALLSTAPDLLRETINALPQHILDETPRWIEARNFVNFMPSSTVGARPVKFRHTARQTEEVSMDLLATLTSRSAALRFSGQFEEAATTAAEAEDALRRAPADKLAEIEHVLPELRMQWGISFELAGRASSALAAFEATYDDSLRGGNARMAVDAAGNSALILATGGSSASAIGWLNRMPAFTDDERSPQAVHTAGNMARAVIALDRLEVDEARAISESRFNETRSPEQWAIRESILARIAALSGDPLARLASLRGVLAATSPDAWSSGVNRWLVILAEAELLIASGQAPAAEALLARVHESADNARASVKDYVATVRARAALFAGEPDRAFEIAMPLVIKGTSTVRTLAELLLVVAVVDVAAERNEDAASRFRSALELIDTHTLPVLLARVPRAALHALLALPGCEISPETMRKVESANILVVIPNPAASLTRRERDVLRLLVAGSSIEEIAREQFVTRNTLKTQVRSIYRKLGTSSREETVRIARTLPPL
jgi:ATP/maltotriose-dependent transcriptional regulator MalT